ncbi:MAG: hypothetical protein KatS3mg102_0520 [Planctomycetota bacterium]|nr:MAG: hypothetical protein KatS3mg102_0520 [Planctomycetota bacterium]
MRGGRRAVRGSAARLASAALLVASLAAPAVAAAAGSASPCRSELGPGGWSLPAELVDSARGARSWGAGGTVLAIGLEDVVEIVDLARNVRRRVAGHQPLVSPDGTYVLVRRWDAEGGCRLVVIEVQSGRELGLPGTLPPGELPRWSPAGGRLAVALRVGRVPEVFLLELDRTDGVRLLRLTFHGGAAPRWIVAGKRLIYEASDGQGGVVLIERDQRGTGAARGFWERRGAEPPALPPRGGPIA